MVQAAVNYVTFYSKRILMIFLLIYIHRKKYLKSAICRYKQVSSILSIIPNNKKLNKTIKINKKLTKYQKKNWKIYVNIFFTLFGRTNRKSAWLWKDTRSQRTDERLPDRSMFAFLLFFLLFLVFSSPWFATKEIIKYLYLPLWLFFFSLHTVFSSSLYVQPKWLTEWNERWA